MVDKKGTKKDLIPNLIHSIYEVVLVLVIDLENIGEIQDFP